MTLSRRRLRSRSIDYLLAALYFAILCLLAFGLTGCATDGAKVDSKLVTKDVVIPIAQSCVPKDTPAAPASYADDGLDSVSDPVDRTTRRAAANQQRRARLAILEPIVTACR